MRGNIAADRQRLTAAGFTIPELIIMMVVTTLLTILVLTFTLNYWSNSATLQSDSDTLATRLNAGDVLRDLLNPASNLINQNSIPDANVSNPDPSAGNSYWLLLHAVPGTITMPSSGTLPVFYFQAPSLDSSKNIIMNGTLPYQDEFVLYLKASTHSLMLRSLANPNASGNRLKTSCPTASASCPADRTLATNVQSIDVAYYSRSDNTINYQSITDPNTGQYAGPDFQAVEAVQMTLHLYRKSTVGGGTNTLNQITVRVALRNG